MQNEYARPIRRDRGKYLGIFDPGEDPNRGHTQLISDMSKELWQIFT